MLLESLLFWALAALSVTAALRVVFHKSIVYSALFLITVFLSIAGIFVLNNADFLAVAQTVVYGVGLTIVMLFGIMFTGDRRFQDRAVTKRQFAAYLFVGAMTFGLLLSPALFAYNVLPTPPMLVAILHQEGSTALLGSALFNHYALPFELASVLLLGAMVGAILISKKTFGEDTGESLKYRMGPSTMTDVARSALETGFNSLPEGENPIYKDASELDNNANAEEKEAVAEVAQ